MVLGTSGYVVVPEGFPFFLLKIKRKGKASFFSFHLEESKISTTEITTTTFG